MCVSAVWTVKALISLVATPGIQASSTDWRTQTRVLIPHWDLRSPHCPSHVSSQLQQPLQAGLPPRINYSRSPAASALASVTGGDWVMEVRGGSPHCYQWHLSEVCVPEALWGYTHMTLGQWGETGIPPPLLLNNGLFNHSNLVGCLIYCNYLECGFDILPYSNDQTIYFVSCCRCSST